MSSANEKELMINVRYNHVRNAVGNFLNKTKAIHLERDMIDFLLNIDHHHREEVARLNEVISNLSQR